jgi:hypothetical protein
MVICSQLPDNDNTSVTNMAEYLAAEVIGEHKLPTPLVWIEHYPEHEGEIGEYSLVRFASWDSQDVCLGGVWRCQVGSPRWAPLRYEELEVFAKEGRGTYEHLIKLPCGSRWVIGNCQSLSFIQRYLTISRPLAQWIDLHTRC